jgi:hypothetical protein
MDGLVGDDGLEEYSLQDLKAVIEASGAGAISDSREELLLQARLIRQAAALDSFSWQSREASAGGARVRESSYPAAAASDFMGDSAIGGSADGLASLASPSSNTRESSSEQREEEDLQPEQAEALQ